MSQGITGPTGSFTYLNSTNNTCLATTNGSYVGIGTTTPSYKLDVSGSINIGPVGSASNGIYFQDGTFQNTAGVTNLYNFGQHLVPYTSVNNFVSLYGIHSAAVSGNGQYQVVNFRDTSNIAHCSLSSNYGSSWTDITSKFLGSLNQGFNTAISGTGQYVTITEFNNSGIFTSSDYGNNFYYTPNILLRPTTIGMSYNGQYQIVLINGVRDNSDGTYTSYYYTSNSGSAWSQKSRTLPYNAAIVDCAICGTGKYQLLSIQNTDLSLSSDYGANFNTTLRPNGMPGQTYNSVAISYSGQYIVATSSNGVIYISSNTGTTWSTVTIPGIIGSSFLSMSSSGQYLALFTSYNSTNGYYISTNYGSNWEQMNLGTNLSNTITQVNIPSKQLISASGNILLAFGTYYGDAVAARLYISNTNTNPGYFSYLSASQGITGPTGSFTYLSASQGITGPTGSFSYLSASQGITGPTGSFRYLVASQGITCPSGSFTYLSASQGITGPTGSFTNLNSTNNTCLATTNGSYVGIGTTTPSYTLDVSGSIHIGPVGSTTNGISFPDGTFQNTAGLVPTIPTSTDLVPYISVNNFGPFSSIYSAAVSATGQYQVVTYIDTTDKTHCMLSSNYGISWTEKNSQGILSQPFNIAISGTGQYITITEFNNQFVYSSNDYGNSFSITLNPVNRPVITSMSYNGKYQIVLVGMSNYYYSSNYGLNNSFSSQNASSTIIDCAICGIGQYQLLSLQNSDLSLSRDYGASFNTVKPNGTGQTYNSVAISYSGQYIVATSSNGVIYISSNTGTTWATVTIPGISGSSYLSMSSTGQYLALFNRIINNSGFYISTDYGRNWTQTNSGTNLSNLQNSRPDTYFYSKQLLSESGNIILALGGYVDPFYTALYISNLTMLTPYGNITTGSFNTIGTIIAGRFNTSGAITAGSFNTTGTITASSFNATSDYRIKENVTLLEDSFILDDLKPVTYLNKKTGNTDIGLIAHELQEVYPFLVTGEKDGREMQSINYIGLIGILIKEIQDLKKEVSALSNFKKCL